MFDRPRPARSRPLALRGDLTRWVARALHDSSGTGWGATAFFSSPPDPVFHPLPSPPLAQVPEPSGSAAQRSDFLPFGYGADLLLLVFGAFGDHAQL